MVLLVSVGFLFFPLVLRVLIFFSTHVMTCCKLIINIPILPIGILTFASLSGRPTCHANGKVSQARMIMPHWHCDRRKQTKGNIFLLLVIDQILLHRRRELQLLLAKIWMLIGRIGMFKKINSFLFSLLCFIGTVT